jgi:hypothetical protein
MLLPGPERERERGEREREGARGQATPEREREREEGENLVDPASSHMLRSRAKPCMSQRTRSKQLVCEWLLTSVVISVIECGWCQLPGHPRDILCNPVANTRLPRSATHGVSAIPLPHGGGLRPAALKTGAWERQCVG